MSRERRTGEVRGSFPLTERRGGGSSRLTGRYSGSLVAQVKKNKYDIEPKGLL